MTTPSPTAGRTRSWLAVVLVTVGTAGCGVSARTAVSGPAPGPAAVREPSLLGDMLDLYRTNPAQAFHTYRDKPQLVAGIRPRKTSQLPEFTGVYKVACDLDGNVPVRDADFDMICTEAEAAALEIGRAGSAVLVLKQSDLATVRPVFFTPAGVEKMAEESRRKQRGN